MSDLSLDDRAKITVLLNDVGIRPLEPEKVRKVLHERGYSDEVIEGFILQRSFAQQ